MANRISRRTILAGAVALFASPYIDIASAALEPLNSLVENETNPSLEEQIKRDLEANLNIKVDSLTAQQVNIGSQKPAYFCELPSSENSGELSLGALNTEKALYFFTNVNRGYTNRVADIITKRGYNSPEDKLIRKEYEGTQITSREEFVSSNIDIANPHALIWLLIEHEKQHERDTGLKIRQCASYITRNCMEQRKQETGYPFLNMGVLAEERGFLIELLRSKKEYCALSDVIAGTHIGKKEEFYRTAATILRNFYDRRMEELGIPKHQYHLLSRQQIRDLAGKFATIYHPDLIRVK